MPEEVLDTNLAGNNEINVKDRIASRGKRFLNMFIDGIVMYIVMIPVIGYFTMSAVDFTGGQNPEEISQSMMSMMAPMYTAIYGILFGYFILMEKLTGKTVGKYLTKTRIVKEDGSEPSWLNIIGRTLSRLIPFEPLSIFFSNEKIAWHDSLPKIYVIED